LKYFLDNCLSPRYARMLSALEIGDVTSLREHYAENLADEIWIPELGKNGWVLIGKDREQLKKPEQRQALITNGVTAFYLAKGYDHLPLNEIAWRLVRCWPMITAMAERSRKGGLFLVQLNGKIEPLPL